MTTIPSITALPDPPQTSDPENFATKADAFIEALITFCTEMNAAITATNTVSGEVSANASSASSSASSASGSASAASSSASSASTSASTASTAATTATNYATKTDDYAASTDNSAKSWAVGGTGNGAPSGGDAKSWAQKTGAAVIAGVYSAKEWAVGTFLRGTSGGGSAKDWATYTGGTVDNADYSAKSYAQAAATSASALVANANAYRTVDVVATSNVSISTGLAAGQTIDGVTLTTGMRVLLTAQSTGSQNGIYDVPSSGSASRSADSNTALLMPSGITVAVTQGAAGARSSYLHTTAPGYTLGTTALTFAKRNNQDVTSSAVPSFSGIAFPATQSASADPNTLDDYEEGTWTPTASLDTAGNSTWTYGARLGLYTKIGNKIHLEFKLTGTPTIGTGSGGFKIGGIPFAANSNILPGGGVVVLSSNFTYPTGYTSPTFAMWDANNIYVSLTKSASTQAFIQASNMVTGASHITSGSIDYIAA